VPWGDTLERWRAESGIRDLDVQVYFGMDPWFDVVPLEWGPCPAFDDTVIREDEEFVISRDYRGITLRNRRDGASMPEWISHPVTCREDWRRYRAERLSGPVEERCTALATWAGSARTRDAAIQVGTFPWGVFGTLRDLMGAEGCLYAFYDDPGLVREIIETWADLWLALYARAVQAVPVDHVHIWEDMSGKQGSLISMAMVKEFMLPSYDRFVAFARGHGVRIVSVDTDGACEELVETMSARGINAFMPFEVQAGNDVEAFRRRYPRLGIMGGLDKTALAAGRGRINAELAKAERMLASGAYLAGFDHAIPPDVPWESYCFAVTELCRMMGR
jgi:uroporphyrinogen decarboxylase